MFFTLFKLSRWHLIPQGVKYLSLKVDISYETKKLAIQNISVAAKTHFVEFLFDFLILRRTLLLSMTNVALLFLAPFTLYTHIFAAKKDGQSS